MADEALVAEDLQKGEILFEPKESSLHNFTCINSGRWESVSRPHKTKVLVGRAHLSRGRVYLPLSAGASEQFDTESSLRRWKGQVDKKTPDSSE